MILYGNFRWYQVLDRVDLIFASVLFGRQLLYHLEVISELNVYRADRRIEKDNS